MKTYRLKYKGIEVTLAKDPFAGGGEANLYAILEPVALMNYVAKIYHEHKRTEKRHQKINYLVQYSPDELNFDKSGHSSIVWVEDLLYDEHVFVGFIMPFTSGEKLEILCTPKIPRKFRNSWKRFDYKVSEQALDLRLKLCFNICAAIYKVHSMQRYVLVDMKPDNIVIQPNGLVSIVDTDSVEVVENGQSLFDAPVATPEYTPPEHYRTLDYDPTEKDTWDRFGLGVILYKLLFGIHPFAASSKAPHEHLVSLDDKIKAGLFVHDPQQIHSFKTIPPPHQKFNEVDPALQALFLQCFVEGHQDPEQRPTAQDWCATILNVLDDEDAFKRYAQVLGLQGGFNSRRFQRPSTILDYPTYNKPMVEMVDWHNTKDFPSFDPSDKPIDTRLEFYGGSNSKNQNIFLIASLFVLFSVFGQFAFFYLFYQLNKRNKAFKKDPKLLRKNELKQSVKLGKKQFAKQRKRVLNAHKRFKRSTKSIVHSAGKHLKTIKTEVQQLKDFLDKQDEKVSQIEQMAMARHQELHQKYIDQALNNRVISRVAPQKYSSLFKLKMAYEQSYKIAVETLIKGKDIRTHPEMQQGKIAVESLLKQQKKTISQQLSEGIETLNQAQQNALSLIENNIDKEADLAPNIKRLWTRYRKIQDKDIVAANQYFKQQGFSSIRQIQSINNQTRTIHLKNGNVVKLREIKNVKVVLRNTWQWYDEIKHKVQVLNEKKSAIKDSFRIKIKELDEGNRMAIKNLERVKVKELQALKIAVQKQVLGTPFEKLHTEYQTTQSYFTELDSSFETEESMAMQDYETSYIRIIEQSKAKAAAVAEKIKILDKELQVYNKKFRHPRVHKNYRLLREELYALQQQLPVLEKKSEELQKYADINFIEYLKKSFYM